ncbi:hypothetical protein CDAR_399071 [Caerostris darwini]|uniref:WW domain containing adaptor with coiled-coil n=1 Tax=Caerostris darwini TaxID=1538125 RepID=A0AAV4T041_9ARAC|nr:hypothetical protein CDAR_399071 [Caerostris darwini]
MKANKLSIPATTSLQKAISATSVGIDKSPPNKIQPQLTGPSPPSSIPQENLVPQILQSLVEEVHVLTSNLASLLAALQSQSPLSHNIQPSHPCLTIFNPVIPVSQYSTQSSQSHNIQPSHPNLTIQP